MYRFLYFVVWKNVGAIEDDILGRFFVLFNSVIGVAFIFSEVVTEASMHVPSIP